MVFKKILLTAFLWGSQVLAAPQRISIMTYNVENLFDEIHDPGKNDWAFLPKALKQSAAHRKRCMGLRDRGRGECLDLDWSSAALDSKLASIAKVVALPFGPAGPDILVLPEVENWGVAERLRTHLSGMQFRKPILIEGHDPRGIDTAIFSKLPLAAAPELHRSVKSMPHARLSRGILHASFRLDHGLILDVFGVHFPAPYHPLAKRIAAFHMLASLTEGENDPQAVQIAAGDFNVPKNDDQRLYRDLMGRDWAVSHHEACQGCQGTYRLARDGSWSFLDAILVEKPKSGQATCRFVPESVRVLEYASLGVTPPSDHSPLVAQLICEAAPKNHRKGR